LLLGWSGSAPQSLPSSINLVHQILEQLSFLKVAVTGRCASLHHRARENRLTDKRGKE
jgi:hypothetical protein